MRRTHFFLAAIVAICIGATIASFGSPALGEDAQTHAQEGMRGFLHQLSEGQRLMFFAQVWKQADGMSEDQRHALREQERAKLLAMSDSERQRLAANLQAKWNALSPSDQEQMREKAATFRAERHRQWHNHVE